MDTNINTINGDAEAPRTKIIFNYAIAKELIRRGFQVVDIKRNRENNEIIHVFSDSLLLRDSLQEIVKNRRAERRKRLEESAATNEESSDVDDDVKEPVMMED